MLLVAHVIFFSNILHKAETMMVAKIVIQKALLTIACRHIQA